MLHIHHTTTKETITTTKFVEKLTVKKYTDISQINMLAATLQLTSYPERVKVYQRFYTI